MNIHEHQAKELLAKYGVETGKGFAAFTPEEAEKAAAEISTPTIVVKAQIHAGGRGKGKFKEAEAGDKGGVRFAKTPAEARQLAEQMLGNTLVTIQTGPAGRTVLRIYIQDAVNIARELYLSALVDRATSRIAFIVSLNTLSAANASAAAFAALASVAARAISANLPARKRSSGSPNSSGCRLLFLAASLP